MDMTWREFQLRLAGYHRQQKQEWYRTRETAYASLIAGGIDPKKLSKEQFMPLDEHTVKPKANNKAFEILKQEQQKYRETVNGSRV